MKHIKKYNENKDVQNEIGEFCENYLAYWLDKGGINIEVIHNKYTDDRYLITIYSTESFSWNSIKDHFIPFINILKSKIGEENFLYNSGGTPDNAFKFSYLGSVVFYRSLNDVINDNLKIVNNFGTNKQMELNSIQFYIKY